MMGGERAGRFGAKVVRLLGQGSRDGRAGGLTYLTENVHLFAQSPKENFAPDLANLLRRRGTQLGYKEPLIRSVDLSTNASFACSRALLVKPNRRGFTSAVYKGPLGNPRTNCWRLSYAARLSKVKDAVVSEGGIGVRRVTASVGPGGTADASWTGRNGILEVVWFYGKCYFELSKARLSFFVVSTAAVGFVMGSGEVVDWMGLVWTSVGTMLAAASANSFNQILEVTNDGRMKRTMRRPLPSGRMSVGHALTFAVTAGITGVTLLACQTTDLAAELGAANVLLYALVYTPLKQIHYANTWVGAVVGGIPPLIGWAAATGDVDKGGWVLASALFFWQIPHFMALAFLCRQDYAKGGYKMLSLLDSSGKRTASCALRNCVYLLPLGFLSHHWGTTSGYFGVENLFLTMGIGATSFLFYLRPSLESARRLFRISLLYLPIVMTAMVVHRIPNPNLSSQGLTAATNTPEFGEFQQNSYRVVHAPTVELEQSNRFQKNRSSKHLSQPPISFISVAPFPFLPAPDYS